MQVLIIHNCRKSNETPMHFLYNQLQQMISHFYNIWMTVKVRKQYFLQVPSNIKRFFQINHLHKKTKKVFMRSYFSDIRRQSQKALNIFTQNSHRHKQIQYFSFIQDWFLNVPEDTEADRHTNWSENLFLPTCDTWDCRDVCDVCCWTDMDWPSSCPVPDMLVWTYNM